MIITTVDPSFDVRISRNKFLKLPIRPCQKAAYRFICCVSHFIKFLVGPWYFLIVSSDDLYVASSLASLLWLPCTLHRSTLFIYEISNCLTSLPRLCTSP